MADEGETLGVALMDLFDIEAENKELERKLDEDLIGDAKEELDSRLKKASEEAKAKGKSTIRTFDMLRKAIHGDLEKHKKEQEEQKKKKEEEDKVEKMWEMAEKPQTGDTQAT